MEKHFGQKLRMLAEMHQTCPTFHNWQITIQHLYNVIYTEPPKLTKIFEDRQVNTDFIPDRIF